MSHPTTPVAIYGVKVGGEGMSLVEMAECHDVTIATVKTWVTRLDKNPT